MNPKSKIILSIIIIGIVFIGFSPVLNQLLIIENSDDGNDSNDNEIGIYPGEDNPYFTLYNYYRSGYLPYTTLNQYDEILEDSSYYYNLINQAFSLTTVEIQLLQQNRFVVLNRMGTDDIVDAFGFYWHKDLPIFITTDTMLHVWHLIFDKVLESTEEDIFFPLLRALVIESMKKIIEHSSLIDIHTIIYFNVALKIIDSPLNQRLPIEIEEASEELYNAIMGHSSPTYTDLTIRFFDDYSQYKPRGHYTKSEILQRYFRLYKWLARIPFFFDNTEMVNSAIQVTWLLKKTSLEYLYKYNIVSGINIWDTIMGFLDIIMGPPNSITPKDLDTQCMNLLGFNWSLNDINENVLLQIQNNVLNDSDIPRPDIPFYVDAINGNVMSPKTFTLFGEIETLDSYSLQHMVHPYIYNRLLPYGLDFAYTCLESNRALQLLHEEYPNEFQTYPDYANVLESVKDNITSTSNGKKETLQWNWISSLKTLATNTSEFNETYTLPEFMNSNVWLDEKLTTIMGSYAQLRHDTILYTKQSTGGIICSTPTAYVEPYPEFYRSLGQLSQVFKLSFERLRNIGYNFTSGYFNFLRYLDTFTNISYWLESISIKELKGIYLTGRDKSFLTSLFGVRESDICGPSYNIGWLPFLLMMFGYPYDEVSSVANSRASLIADIHTDPNTKQVLHISTGFLEHIIALVPSWDGHEIPVIGPVFSYYEFPAPNYNRLTDEEWRGILSVWIDGEDIDSHDFSLIQRGFWAKNYMASTSITTDIIYYDDLEYTPPYWF